MKKNQPKRQRIPRRGPGVAELEKILKEQEKGQDSDTQFQDISPPPPSPPPPPPPPFPNSPLPPPPSLLPQDYSSWSNLPLFPTLDLIPPTLPTAAAATAGPVFPTTQKPDTQMSIPPHFFPNFQFSSLNRQYYNSMVNFTPGSASSSPSATSSAAKYIDQIIEHPSSQRSTDFNHILWTWPEEQEQMVNGKRARFFLDENPNIESRRIPSFSVKDSSSSSSSSSFEINRKNINFDSNFRDQTKRGFSGQLAMNSTKSSGSNQLGEERRNLNMALGSSSTPNQFAPFDNNFQETMEASQHRDEGGSASDYNKITFNYLYESNSKLKGGIVATIGSEAEAEAEAKAEGDGIDLDLKL